MENYKTPEISVVIAAYNNEKYIKETIKSVLNQTFQNFEIVVVNDGSKDRTEEEIKKFNDHRIKYLYQKNQGVAAARNKGIELSQGEFIAMMDGDDIWLPKKLELQLEAIKKSSEIGLAFGWIYCMDEDNYIIGQKKPVYHDKFYENLLMGNYVECTSMPLIRKECFDKVGKFDGYYWGTEDWDMWFRIAKEYKFACVEDFILIYRIHNTSMSTRYREIESGVIKLLEREFNSCKPEIKKLKNTSFSIFYQYMSNLGRRTQHYKDAIRYMYKAFGYDAGILNKEYARKSFIKLLISIFIPYPLLVSLRKVRKELLNVEKIGLGY